MKRLALILLAVPLAACATSRQGGQFAAPAPGSLHPVTPTMMHRISEAATSCVAARVIPSDPHYGQCINGYLQYHYGWNVIRDTKNAIWAVYPIESNPLADGSAANFPPAPAVKVSVPKAG